MAEQHGTRTVTWANADGYEAYMGRWSRPAAREFLAWLPWSPGARWIDVGCGTGALTRAILEVAEPREVVSIDASAEYVARAAAEIGDPRARFEVGDAGALPVASDAYDAVVAGLVLNHVPDATAAVAEMARTTRPGGTVGAFVWDYAGEMQLMRSFWRVATALDPASAALDRGRQSPICRPEPLASLFRSAGLGAVEVGAIDVPMPFRDFDDYWQPHLMGSPSPAPRYAASLGEAERATLREQIRASLPIAPDGSIQLVSRAWTVRGIK